jgi:hypothetical protein
MAPLQPVFFSLQGQPALLGAGRPKTGPEEGHSSPVDRSAQPLSIQRPNKYLTHIPTSVVWPFGLSIYSTTRRSLIVELDLGGPNPLRLCQASSCIRCYIYSIQQLADPASIALWPQDAVHRLFQYEFMIL